ncbi:MAG: TIGR02300 family protein [Alphaproteobacteria bacterium]|nr:MAG: TIGR02300 family protein [Alphaproteobacteria bacterium]
MPNPEWGVKRVCPGCGSRFYDLNNDPATCPECGESFTLDQLSLKRTRTERSEQKAVPEKAAAAVDPEDDLLDDDDGDIEVGDDILEEDDGDDDVPLDEIAERTDEDSES